MTLYSVSTLPDQIIDSPPPRVRASITDDNLFLRLGLRSVLEASGQVSVVADTSADADAIRRAERLSPDVLLMGAHGAWWAGELALTHGTGEAAVLIVADTDDLQSVRHAFRRGATGYLVYGQFDSEELVVAVLDAARRQPHLSPGVLATVVDSFRTPAAAIPVQAEQGPPSGTALSSREAELMEAHRAGPHQPRDRSGPLHQRKDGKEPCQSHLHQTRRP